MNCANLDTGAMSDRSCLRTLTQFSNLNPRYRRTSNLDDDLPSAPMTEPLKRRNITNNNIQEPTTSLRNGKIVRPKPSSNLSAPRKSSYGDYDSELVDGKYITSVPIISMNNHDDEFNSNSNLR